MWKNKSDQWLTGLAVDAAVQLCVCCARCAAMCMLCVLCIYVYAVRAVQLCACAAVVWQV